MIQKDHTLLFDSKIPYPTTNNIYSMKNALKLPTLPGCVKCTFTWNIGICKSSNRETNTFWSKRVLLLVSVFKMER